MRWHWMLLPCKKPGRNAPAAGGRPCFRPMFGLLQRVAKGAMMRSGMCWRWTMKHLASRQQLDTRRPAFQLLCRPATTSVRETIGFPSLQPHIHVGKQLSRQMKLERNCGVILFIFMELEYRSLLQQRSLHNGSSSSGLVGDGSKHVSWGAGQSVAPCAASAHAHRDHQGRSHG